MKNRKLTIKPGYRIYWMIRKDGEFTDGVSTIKSVCNEFPFNYIVTTKGEVLDLLDIEIRATWSKEDTPNIAPEIKANHDFKTL